MAREVFAQYGRDGAKTKQIAEAAGITEAVLYRHFRSKEEMFEEAMLAPLENLARDLSSHHENFGHITGEERHELSTQTHLQIFETVHKLMPLLGAALFSDREAGIAFYRERLMPVFAQASSALSKGMATRVQSQIISPRTMFLVLFGMYFGIEMYGYFGSRDDLDMKEIARDVTDVIAFGVYAPPSQ